MADQQRKLNIPRYQAPSTPSGDGGASAGAQGPAPRRPAGAPRGESRAQARERVAGQNRARAEQATAAAQARAQRDKLVKDARRDPAAKLKLDTLQAGESYMESLRKSGILGAGETKETQRKQLTGMHQVYASMMVLQCVQPLQKGLSGENVASTLGMGAAMWLLSPNFRTQLGVFSGQMGDVLRARIEGKGAKKDAKAQRKYDSAYARGREHKVRDKWTSRLEKIETAERGHRLPFTTQSAAMTEVALAEAAYADMRRPGADRAMVKDRYDSAMSALNEYIADDGLSREEVSRSMRVIVGQRLERDPAIANVFGELGHGRFTKSEPREVYLSGSNEPLTVWTGDFVDSYEGRTVSSGSFSLRPPMGVNEHRVMATQTLAAEIASQKTVGDLNDVLSQYVVASSVNLYPEVVETVEDPVARARLAKARTMFGSMAADGLTSDERNFAYTAAYSDAVAIIEKMNPELGQQWAAQYGDNWQESVAESMRHYSDMGAKAAQEARAEQPQTKPPTERHKRRTERKAPVPNARVDEDIIDAELVDDDLDLAAEDVRTGDEDIVDAEVVGAVELDDLEFDDFAGTDDFTGANARSEPIAERVAEDVDAWEGPITRKARNEVDEVHFVPLTADRAVEDMSDLIAADITEQMEEGDPDGSTWEARHVYRSPQRALGEFDPSKMLAAGSIASIDDYASEVTVDELDAHRPWDDDRVANARGVRMVLSAKHMAGLGIPPQEQNHLHAAAYVRGLEKVVARHPSYEEVVQRMVSREGGSPQDWREHEYSGAVGRSSSERPERSFADQMGQLQLDEVGSESAQQQARGAITGGLRSSSAPGDYERGVEVTSTSARVRRARVNQHYNEIETGGITGFGSDDAAPLQEAGYELG